ncbi:MAG: hypothetical protein Unbinned1446contig1004_27 [Prokaryotic dsDNA virus sp.]|nr:MAG: hypothetical protein Unbinned1446contig1004_27 [Prokaryotic dsDNA virus sp.]|tara:strand:- start:29679 stop:30629 length:951 start_codon:yes stop_codon:yes gene_type:complete
MKGLNLIEKEDLFGRTKQYIDELDLNEVSPPPFKDKAVENIQTSYTKESLKIIDAKDFLGATPPPIDWLVEGVVEKKNLVMLVGAPKTAKSWFSIELGLTIASGGDLFNDPLLLGNGRKGSVLFCFLEDGKYNVQARVNALAKSKNIPDVKDLDLMFRFGGGIDIGDPQKAIQFANAIKEIKPDLDLLVFDPFRNLHFDDENDSAKIIKIMENLRNIRDITGAAVLVIHHTRKPASTDKANPGFTIRGSGAIFGAVDGLISMSSINDINAEGITNNVFVRVKGGREAKPFSVGLHIIDGSDGRARLAKWKVESVIL